MNMLMTVDIVGRLTGDLFKSVQLMVDFPLYDYWIDTARKTVPDQCRQGLKKTSFIESFRQIQVQPLVDLQSSQQMNILTKRATATHATRCAKAPLAGQIDNSGVDYRAHSKIIGAKNDPF